MIGIKSKPTVDRRGQFCQLHGVPALFPQICKTFIREFDSPPRLQQLRS
jgi:hypothetical protein